MRSCRVKNCLDTSLTKLASGSLMINMTPRPLPSSLKFKACVLLSTFDSFEDDTLLMASLCCGVQLLFPGSRIDENAVDNVVDDDGNEVESDIKDDADKTQEGEESRHDDDAETRSKKRMRFSPSMNDCRFCKGKISGLKVLVVPDYVDKIKQLGVIVKRLQWFGSGSSL
ncbi:BnaC09g39450D [Brassica napus]|uniref:BnaC09g39450D protein n=1 Tax=Brassica napus TaxID=3708 RepID=A0A078GG33_BRANA|nr:BnaC09g39450D [Brassica napus]